MHRHSVSPEQRPRKGLMVVARVAATLLVLAIAFVAVRRPFSAGKAPHRFPRWAIGVDYDYALSFRSRVTAASGQNLANFELEGPLSIVALQTEGTTILSLNYSGVLRILGETAKSVETQILEQAFKRGAIVELDEGGRLKGLRLDSSLPDFVEQVWQTIGAALQTSSAPGRAQTWSAEETDNVGSYQAAYVADGVEGRDHRVDRRKVTYTTTRSAGIAYKLSEGSASFRLDAEERLLGLTVEERLEAAPAEPMPAFDSRTSLALTRNMVNHRVHDLAATLAAALNHPIIQPGPRARTVPVDEIETAQIGGRELPELLATLTEIEVLQAKRALSTKENDRAGRAYVSLTARLKRYPAELEPIADHIRGGGPLTNTLTDALRDAGTKEAQEVLRSVVAGPSIPATERLEATRALSMVAAPTSETAEMLDGLRRDPTLKVQATYGVGSNAFRLAATDAVLAERLVEDLIAQLRAATTDGERLMVFTALGNAGAISSVPALKPYLAAESESDRLGAARALRRIPGDEVDQLLAASSSDKSGRVRASAQDAISERRPTDVLVAVVARAVTSDVDFQARTVATRTAAEWLASQPILRASLVTAATTDTEPDIRRIAQQAVDRWVASN